MAITYVARLKAKPGCEDQLEQALREMVSKVRASEPDTLDYVLHRGSRDSSVFVVYEVYKDKAAFDHHTKTPHMAELAAKLGPLLDGRPGLDALNELDRR